MQERILFERFWISMCKVIARHIFLHSEDEDVYIRYHENWIRDDTRSEMVFLLDVVEHQELVLTK